MSERILADMRDMRPTAWVYWQAIDDSAATGWGLLHSHLNHPTDYGATLNPKYYVMGNYSKFIRPGYKLLLVDDAHSLAAYDLSTKTLVIVTTNSTGSDTTIRYDLSKFARLPRFATPHRTAENENLVRLDPVAITGRAFSAVSKARSVTTYVVTGAVHDPSVSATANDTATGAGPTRFSYTGPWAYARRQAGAYRGDCHWSRAPDASCAVEFHGAQILLYGAIGPANGIAAMSVDSGPEVEVDLYAVRRVENTLLYASPTLPDGPHTLKVRITGRKRAVSSAGTVTVDRVDIVAAPPPVNANGRVGPHNRAGAS
jgi:hypothetical protein